MKKIIVMMLTGIMVAGMAACGNAATESKESATPTASAEPAVVEETADAESADATADAFESSDATADAEEEGGDSIAALFTDCANMEVGTAGSSLKTAALSERFLSYAFIYGFTESSADEAKDVISNEYNSLDAATQEQFAENFDSVAFVIDDAFSDWDAAQTTFEDAGCKESMQTLMEAPGIEKNWEVFRDAVKSVIGGR